MSDLQYAGLRNDKLSSITVPAGYLVELYEHFFYAEEQVVVGAYKDSSEEMVCVPIKAELNDKTSSLIIKR